MNGRYTTKPDLENSSKDGRTRMTWVTSLFRSRLVVIPLALLFGIPLMFLLISISVVVWSILGLWGLCSRFLGSIRFYFPLSSVRPYQYWLRCVSRYPVLYLLCALSLGLCVLYFSMPSEATLSYLETHKHGLWTPMLYKINLLFLLAIHD